MGQAQFHNQVTVLIEQGMTTEQAIQAVAQEMPRHRDSFDVMRDAAKAGAK